MPQEPGEASGRQDPGLFPRLGVSRRGAGAAGLSFLKESLLPRVKVPVGSLLDSPASPAVCKVPPILQRG